MPIARLAVAVFALLVGAGCVAGCGVGRTHDAARSPGAESPTVAAERSAYPSPSGEKDVRQSVAEGVVLTASAPTTFTPTDTAYPPANRAIAVDMILENRGAIAFRPAQLIFGATVQGKPAEQVIDSTQGYNGVSSATDEIPPGQKLSFTVAFGVPEQSCSVHVWVRPDTAGSVSLDLYDGVV